MGRSTNPVPDAEPSWLQVYRTTARIYLQRKARRHWQGTVITLTGMAVLAASFAYTGRRSPGPDAASTAGEQVGRQVTGRPTIPGGTRTAGRIVSASPPPASAVTDQGRPPAVLSPLDKRKTVAARLLDNRRLTMKPAARRQLASGLVSLETMRAMETVLPAYPLSVVSFAGARGGQLRTVTVNGVNRVPLRTGQPRTLAVVRKFRALPGDLRPVTDDVTRQGGQTVLVLRFR